MALADRLLRRPHPPEEPVRLLGLSVSSLTGGKTEGEQLALEFETDLAGSR
jgi:DNA polymerase-4